MNTNLTFKSRPVNTNRLKVAHNALKRIVERPTFFIEDADLNGDVVNVTYINEAILNGGLSNEDDWKEVEIETDSLIGFIISRGLNAYEFNTSDNDGCHVQESGPIPMDYYLKYNLNDAVKAYIEAGRELNHV